MYLATMILSFMIFACAIHLALATALPEGLSLKTRNYGAGMQGYEIAAMTFEGTIGGIPVTSEGSIDEIIAKMELTHPGITANLTAASAGERPRFLGEQPRKIGEKPRVLGEQPRDIKTNLFCCPTPGHTPDTWLPAHVPVIQQGIDYLNHVSGVCGARAHSCVRVSCSYNSGIYLCNDRDNDIKATCPWIASFATDIINSCQHYEDTDTPVVCGQEFDDEHFNVIVHYDHC